MNNNDDVDFFNSRILDIIELIDEKEDLFSPIVRINEFPVFCVILIFGIPLGRGLSYYEISKLTGYSVRAIQDHVNNLEKMGLVYKRTEYKSDRKERKRRVRINYIYPCLSIFENLGINDLKGFSKIILEFCKYLTNQTFNKY